MREHVRLGRLAGVDVGINWSVLAIFLLITFGLATGRYPQLFPDMGTTAYGAAGVAAGIVFFLSLLAHEISHAVVALPTTRSPTSCRAWPAARTAGRSSSRTASWSAWSRSPDDVMRQLERAELRDSRGVQHI